MDGNECASHAGAGPSANVDRPSYIYLVGGIVRAGSGRRQRCAQRHISGVPLQVLKYRWEHKKRKKIGKSGNGKQPPWQEPPLMIRSSEQA
jgi:hypothetical protein